MKIWDSVYKCYSSIKYKVLTRYSTQYLTRARVTRPQSINFTIRLGLNLGHRLLVFASTTNLKSGHRYLDQSHIHHLCHRVLPSPPPFPSLAVMLFLQEYTFSVKAYRSFYETMNARSRKSISKPGWLFLSKYSAAAAIFGHILAAWPHS